jgi:hypothetical protein
MPRTVYLGGPLGFAGPGGEGAMNANVNLAAPIGVLGFLGAGLVLLALGLVALHALVVRRFGRARVTLALMACVLAVYFGLMLVFSLASGERVLARGEEKYFCEVDCHLAYSVADVTRAKMIGEGPGAASARGEFYVVTVRTRFDETTISPQRGDALLHPNPRSLTVRDDRGRVYPVSDEGERALASFGGTGTPIETPLRPGESYTTRLVFDLPEDARSPTLLINESDLPTRFIIGHENSLLHKKTEFSL